VILGIGTDIVEVQRIRHAIERFGDRFVKRIYTEVEIAYCSSRKNSAMHYAGRFASKEAAFKAMRRGWGGDISWKDVQVHNLPSGAPVLTFFGKALELVTEQKMTNAHVSISHIEELAVATVVLETDLPPSR
jgi:holo-[acyl-carrier protein] synthase